MRLLFKGLIIVSCVMVIIGLALITMPKEYVGNVSLNLFLS